MFRITHLFPSTVSCLKFWSQSSMTRSPTSSTAVLSAFCQPVWLFAKLLLSLPVAVLFFHHCQLQRKKDLCDVVYLDFKKSFDSITRPELLYKLWCHCITGPLWQWFQAHLLKRFHLVSIEGYSSELLPVRSGVPQGGVLCPLLHVVFLTFINNIPNATSFCTARLFADDTKLLKSISNKIQSTLMQQDLDSLAAWCSSWKLSLNTSKYAAMRFSLSSSLPNTYM